MTVEPPVQHRPTLSWPLAHTLAGALAALIMTMTAVIRGTAPFGPVTRNINDQGNQLLPFHAHLWDLLHGTTPSGWQFTWEAGAGVPFLPDYAIYLSSPFAPLVALFPRDRIELAMFVLTVLKIAVAAAAMSILLRALRPEGNPWLAALGAAAYATCGWTVDDSSFMTMWLDGLIAFPLLCLAGEWARRGRRPVWSVVLIAACWWANFYIGYMASLGAAVFVLARVLTTGWTHADDDRSRLDSLRPTLADLRDVVGGLVRFAWRGALGVAAIGVIFVPMFLAVKSGQPATVASLQPASWASFASRLLPLTEAVNASPGWYVGSLCLLAAAALPFLASIPLRVRVVYPLLLALLAVSWQWQPTQLIWNAGDTPNGGAFRCALVGAGWIVVMAWLAVGALPWTRRVWVSAVATLAVIAAVGSIPNPHAQVHPAAVLVLAAAVGIAFLAAHLPTWHARGSMAAVVLVMGTFLAEGVATAVTTENLRDQAFWHSPVWRSVEERATPALNQARNHSAWPEHRIGVELGMGGNQPQLMGYPGLEYYSSVMPITTTRTLVELGAKSSGWGRRVHTTHDPVYDALFGVSSWVKAPTLTAAPSFLPLPAQPVVRVLPDVPPTPVPAAFASPPAESVFGRRNAVLGGVTYLNGPTTYASGTSASAPTPTGADKVKVTLPVTFTTTCQPGSLVQVHLPLLPSVLNDHQGTVADNVPPGGPGRSRGSSGVTTLGITRSGAVKVTAAKLPRESATGFVTPHPISCYSADDAAAFAALARGQAPASTPATPTPVARMWEKLELRDNQITAVTATPVSRGTALITTAALEGWSCTADGQDAPITPIAGLLAVKLNGQRELACTYRTPGLQAGALLTGLAVLATAVVGLWPRLRALRPSPPPAGDRSAE